MAMKISLSVHWGDFRRGPIYRARVRGEQRTHDGGRDKSGPYNIVHMKIFSEISSTLR